MIRLKNRIFHFYRSHSRGIIIAAVCMLSGWFFINGIMQGETIKNNRERTAQLKTMTEEERDRQTEIDDLKTKVNTDEYIERIASEKLGLVKSNATIFYDVSQDN